MKERKKTTELGVFLIKTQQQQRNHYIDSIWFENNKENGLTASINAFNRIGKIKKKIKTRKNSSKNSKKVSTGYWL